MRLLIQALPFLASTLFLFLPNLATDYPIPEDTPIYDYNTGLHWTDGNFKSPDATMTWEAANNWVTSLNAEKYGEHNDWWLPSTPYGSTWEPGDTMPMQTSQNTG